MDADLRRISRLFDRRHRAGAVESQHHLRRHRRTEQPPELVVWRRHLQVDRRRTHVRVHGTEGDADDRQSRRAPQGSEHRLRRGRRPPLRAESGAWRLQDDRRRQDLDEHEVHRQRHRLHRSRDAPDQPEHAVRGVVSAAPAALGLQRRRAGQRHLADRRRRQDVDTRHRQRPASQPAPRPHRTELQPVEADRDLRAARSWSERRHRGGRQRRWHARPARAGPRWRWRRRPRRSASPAARSHQERRLAIGRRRQVVEVHEQQQQPPDVLQQDPRRPDQPRHRLHDRRKRVQVDRRREDVQHDGRQ